MKMMPPDVISHENQLQHLSEPSIFMLDVFWTADHAGQIFIPHRSYAEQQEVCSSIWGQQLRRRGRQTESSSVLQEDRICPSIQVLIPKRMNASPYNTRASTHAQPHEATCTPRNKS